MRWLNSRLGGYCDVCGARPGERCRAVVRRDNGHGQEIRSSTHVSRGRMDPLYVENAERVRRKLGEVWDPEPSQLVDEIGDAIDRVMIASRELASAVMGLAFGGDRSVERFVDATACLIEERMCANQAPHEPWGPEDWKRCIQGLDRLVQELKSHR